MHRKYKKTTVDRYINYLRSLDKEKEYPLNKVLSKLKKINSKYKFDINILLKQVNHTFTDGEWVIIHDVFDDIMILFFDVFEVSRKTSEDSYVPNLGICKRQKIDFVAPHTKIIVKTQQKEKKPIINNSIVTKENFIQEFNPKIDDYQNIIKKVEKENLFDSLLALTKNEREIVLMKYYLTKETSHSFCTFKNIYSEFLNKKVLNKKSLYIQNIMDFLVQEIF